ncbi:peptidase [Sphingomonas radiodurans]|uniref:peptidase n=1 Tax=Sphingomonas radiodurans TaxID=2890321 RepID=UPI001E63190D|nr:peptidase [Sphingomonas radiodurans]WBH17176.1 peptidase [Sphingomonas radiodurans]
MNWKRIGLVALIGGIGMGTAACTDGYGYGGASLGYGSAFVGDPYLDGGFGGPGFGGPGFGGAGLGGFNNGFGWYNNFYYPGTGVYVYDRNRRPFRWNDGQRRYWQGRPGFNQPGARANWNGFRQNYRAERRDYRGDLRDNRQAFRNGTIDRGQFRDGRRDARREFRTDVRRDYRDYRRENRADGIRTPRPSRSFRRTPRNPR